MCQNWCILAFGYYNNKLACIVGKDRESIFNTNAHFPHYKLVKKVNPEICVNITAKRK